MKLSDVQVGATVMVIGVPDDPGGRRLEALGFLQGTSIEVTRRAPLGDPTLYRLRGTELSLRHATAAMVEVEGEHV